MADKTITWDADMLERFKAALATAQKMHKSQFTFDGNEFLVAYAKYLVEFLDEKFHPSPLTPRR